MIFLLRPYRCEPHRGEEHFVVGNVVVLVELLAKLNLDIAFQRVLRLESIRWDKLLPD